MTDYTVEMEKQIRKAFPQFDDKKVRYTINKASNFIRDCKEDVYQVWIDKVVTYHAQYATRTIINVGKVKVHIEIQVD